MVRKPEKVNALFDDFESGVVDDRKRYDSTDEDFSLDELDVFQLLSLWRVSGQYALKQMRILERMRYVVLSLDLEELIAAVACSPVDSEISQVISSQLIKTLENGIHNYRLNVGDLKAICSFLSGNKKAILSINDISCRKFGYSLYSKEFNAALQEYKKSIIGRKQSLCYGLFNLILKHNPQLEDDELFPLRAYLSKLIIEKRNSPTFAEAFKMWQNSVRFPEIESMLVEFMVGEIASIKSLTPCNKMPSWFLTALSKRQEFPDEVVTAMSEKIMDFRFFGAEGVSGFLKNIESTAEESQSQEEVSVSDGIFANFKTELFLRIRNFFGHSWQAPEVECAER